MFDVASSDTIVSHRASNNGLLEQPVKEQPARSGFSAVEPEHEFVEIKIKLAWLHRPMMGAHQPALKQRYDTVNTGHRYMGWRRRTEMNRFAVFVPMVFDAVVGRVPIAVYFSPEAHGIFDKRDNILAVTLLYLSYSDSAEPFWLQHFHGDGNQRLGSVALAPKGADGILAVCEGKEGFVDFNKPMKQVPARTNHGPAQPVKYGPGGFVAPDPKNVL